MKPLRTIPFPPSTLRSNTSITTIGTLIFLTNGCRSMESGVSLHIERRWWELYSVTTLLQGGNSLVLLIINWNLFCMKKYLTNVKMDIASQTLSFAFVLSLFQQLKDESVPGYQNLEFKASNGWRCNFINRRKLKYRRRKSGKQFSANKHVHTYLNFLQRLRFKLLPPIDETIPSDALWGRFPPSHRYNMDQVPLPFVVSQDFTFTVENDTNIHITCPSESLRKRQWTMHVVTNAGDGDKRHAWVDLVTKGKGQRIKEAETQRYHPDVDMFWQKNDWVDGEGMKKLAHKFVREKLDKHGDDWVVLYADNLSAHLLPEVKTIFGTNHVLVVYFPPNMTEMVQPIDAGYGRSLRCAIGRELDAWLMDAANLLKWESKMSAMER